MEQQDGIYDASGRWLAPLEGNAQVQPSPEKLCVHGEMCSFCEVAIALSQQKPLLVPKRAA